MDYEKKYKEALAHAREIHRNEEEKRSDMEWLFPELKESEDEKIRKSLIILLQHFCKGYRVPGLDFPVSYKDMIAWLEKQSEQKLAWSEEDSMMIKETLYFLREYQQSNRCKDENGMQNSVTCEKWLKCLKQRITE